jgi:hypothetical protein
LAKKNSPKLIQQEKYSLDKKNPSSTEKKLNEKIPTNENPIKENLTEENPYENIFPEPEKYPVHVIFNKSIDSVDISFSDISYYYEKNLSFEN